MIEIEIPLMVCGFPASGKSTFANKLAMNGCKILEWDGFVKEFGSVNELAEEKDIAIQMFRHRMKMMRPDVVVDVFQSREDRKRVLEAFDGNIGAAFVRCSLETCLKRNLARKNSFLNNDELKSIAYSFEPILPSEGFKNMYVIDGE